MSFTIAEKPVPAGREGPGIFLEPVDPLTHPGWDDLVAGHPDATVFHTAAWARVLSTTYRYQPTYFASMEKNHFIALLPLMEIRSWLTGTRGVSLPFTDECLPILPEGMSWVKAVGPVIDRAERRGWKTLEIRGLGRIMGDLPASGEYLTHALDLTAGEEELFAGYRTNVQRNIRKAKRAGIMVMDDRTPAGLREFYRLNCLTRREHGLPPQPVRFFESLGKNVVGKDLGTLLLARYQGRTIAGAVFLHFGGKAIYKYGASDRRYQQLRANNLLFHEGIRALCRRGIRTLSFGRTDVHHEGLRQFKLSWGAEENRLQYVHYDVRSKSWLSNKKARGLSLGSMITRMPLPILRLVGSIAYRHAG
jgi:hypothetical protein